jgi:hypothetical protein
VFSIKGQIPNRIAIAFGVFSCVALVFPLILQIPSLAIIGGDQSQYAKAAIDLYQSWQNGPIAGWSEMVASMKFKPPILPWTGQFLLPFRDIFGSADAALLYGMAALLLLSLVLFFVSVLKFSPNEIAPAFYGTILAATAPLFQYLFHQYMVEPIQFFVVCWFLWILCNARTWDRSMVLAQLVWASSVTLLSKSSSPAYVVVPGLLASYFLLASGGPVRGWNFHKFSNASAMASGLVAALATVAWYTKNYTAVKAHAMVASSGSVAAYWGKEDSYLNTMIYWFGAIRDSFFPEPVLWLYLVVLAAGIYGFFMKRPLKVGLIDLLALVAIAQLALLILLFSTSSNRVTRYLLAMLPYFSILGVWGIHHAGSRSFLWAICLAMSGIWFFSDGVRRPPGNNLANSKILSEVVDRAFPQGRLGESADSIVAIDPACRGDWLAPVPANYEAAKFALANGISNEMNFHYFGGGFFGSDWEGAWKHLLATNPQSIFVLSPDSPEMQKVRFNKGLQGENRRKFYEVLANRELFQEPRKLSLDGRVLVYYPTEKFEALAGKMRQIKKPTVDLEQTQRLFKNSKIASIKEPAGKVEWKADQGILIHPSGEPTVLDLDLRAMGLKGEIELVGWILQLPVEALDGYSGIFGVKITSGDKILAQQKVTPYENLSLSVDVETTPSLQISVDMGNGTAVWDWFFLGVANRKE